MEEVRDIRRTLARERSRPPEQKTLESGNTHLVLTVVVLGLLAILVFLLHQRKHGGDVDPLFQPF